MLCLFRLGAGRSAPTCDVEHCPSGLTPLAAAKRLKTRVCVRDEGASVSQQRARACAPPPVGMVVGLGMDGRRCLALWGGACME